MVDQHGGSASRGYPAEPVPGMVCAQPGAALGRLLCC